MPTSTAAPSTAPGACTPGTAAWISERVRRLTGLGVASIELPGGAGRGSAEVVLSDGRRMIATRRATPARTATEAVVLHALSRAGAPVPKAVGHHDGLLLQERVEGARLSVALAAPDADRVALGGAAVAALEACRKRLARLPQLAGRLPGLGTRSGWTDDFVSRPAFLSHDLRIAPPACDFGALARAIDAAPAHPTRWDARTGNAVVRPDGRVVWFDWDVVGRRAGVEDVAWLLADEHWTPDAAESVEALRAGGVATSPMLVRMAVLLAAARMGTIHARVARLGWADGDAARADDGIGATPGAVDRLAARGAALATTDAVVAPFAEWFPRAASALRGTGGGGG
ncbi:hypothetical protein JQC91_13490 [Jannaschia sp. Os4]|uniref:hypothetical protein n=1 Tax=Jannaschia sp. Os4 TaxID=2807617 RepID=UPI0019393534|nr:hypothetical protein [Jannaschia sp. Os4]MBM2577317.1 hypothetical protein [Jannaschia sp. Os4]